MSALRERYMRLSLLINPLGFHAGAWRLPESRPETFCDFARYVEMAQTAERGFFDLLFVPDLLTIKPAKPQNLGRASIDCVLEPLTLLSALSAVTAEIGLAGTMTTTYTQPYHVARMISSLDHISGGRAAWNLVTSANPSEATLFGLREPAPVAERYRRAREFVDVVNQLWDSWDDDAFLFDAEGGQFFDPAKMHPIAHHGEFLDLEGMMSLPRCPQGRPLISQAGQSVEGRQLAAETADIIFAQQANFEIAQIYYKDVKARAVAAGRSADDICIMPGVMVYVGETEAEARAKFKRVDEAFDVRVGMESLSLLFGIDMSCYALDEPLPKDLPTNDKVLSQRAALIAAAERDNLTVRQLIQSLATRNHWVLCGTPQKIVDEMERYFNEGAADSFNIVPGVMPENLRSFVDLVVPELQRRGLVRTKPMGKTLREKFGLKCPAI